MFRRWAETLRPWAGRIAAAGLLGVLASVASVAVRTETGVGPQDDVGLDGLLVLAFVAVPALVCIALSRRWPLVCLAEGALALLAWVPLGIAGDLSCVDCGFAIVVPLLLAVPQFLLLGLGAVVGSRSRG